MEWDLLELVAGESGPTADPPPRHDGPASANSLQDRPSAPELLEAAREFLEHDVIGAVDGRVAFHTRVAVNALGIVERELVLGPTLDATIRERLAGFLEHDDELATLIAELAAGIRSGAFDDRPDTLAVTRDLVR